MMNGWTEKFTPQPNTRFRGLGSFARNHSPLLIFCALVLVVFGCMQLPWGESGIRLPGAISPLDANKTMEIGNGTLTYKPNNNDTKPARFAKVAVASGFEDILYEKAIMTHVRHAEKHGYPMYMARENAANGMFNKIAYVIDVLLNELYKPADERVAWLL